MYALLVNEICQDIIITDTMRWTTLCCKNIEYQWNCKARLTPLMVPFGCYKFLVLIVLYIFCIVVNGLWCHTTTLNFGQIKYLITLIHHVSSSGICAAHFQVTNPVTNPEREIESAKSLIGHSSSHAEASTSFMAASSDTLQWLINYNDVKLFALRWPVCPRKVDGWMDEL